mmetsp:Transcript_32439/g.49615  ORF Transcript_32439/g.49615 Transcript_32439/m.49615 type:complete len:155 (-) Transcript_32439:57-521(-)
MGLVFGSSSRPNDYLPYHFDQKDPREYEKGGFRCDQSLDQMIARMKIQYKEMKPSSRWSTCPKKSFNNRITWDKSWTILPYIAPYHQSLLLTPGGYPGSNQNAYEEVGGHKNKTKLQLCSPLVGQHHAALYVLCIVEQFVAGVQPRETGRWTYY